MPMICRKFYIELPQQNRTVSLPRYLHFCLNRDFGTYYFKNAEINTAIIIFKPCNGKHL